MGLSLQQLVLSKYGLSIHFWLCDFSHIRIIPFSNHSFIKKKRELNLCKFWQAFYQIGAVQCGNILLLLIYWDHLYLGSCIIISWSSSITFAINYKSSYKSKILSLKKFIQAAKPFHGKSKYQTREKPIIVVAPLKKMKSFFLTSVLIHSEKKYRELEMKFRTEEHKCPLAVAFQGRNAQLIF